MANDRLSRLPLELLLLIFQELTDFSSLWSLIHASPYLSSVFDDYACPIVNAILNNKVPSPIRALMQTAFSLHKGLFEEYILYGYLWSEVPVLPSVTGSLSEMRWLIRLAHQVHVHAHICIEQSMQKCLNSCPSDLNFPEGFEAPTWIEEQRSLLAFWRFLIFTKICKKGRWWYSGWSRRMYTPLPEWLFLCASDTAMVHITTVRDYLYRNYAVKKSKKDLMHGQRIYLAPIPKDREFGWKCQPSPSWEAIFQNQRPDESSSERMTWEAVFKNKKWDETPSRERTPVDDRGVEAIHMPVEQSSDEELGYLSNDSKVETSNERASELIENASEDGSSSAGECDEFQNDSDSLHDYRREENFAIEGQRMENFNIDEMLDPFQSFTPDPMPEESLSLQSEPPGMHLWDIMLLNRDVECQKYVKFDAYSRHGLVLWEEWRLVKFGLWSKERIKKVSDFYLKWARFFAGGELPLDFESKSKMYKYVPVPFFVGPRPVIDPRPDSDSE